MPASVKKRDGFSDRDAVMRILSAHFAQRRGERAGGSASPSPGNLTSHAHAEERPPQAVPDNTREGEAQAAAQAREGPAVEFEVPYGGITWCANRPECAAKFSADGRDAEAGRNYLLSFQNTEHGVKVADGVYKTQKSYMAVHASSRQGQEERAATLGSVDDGVTVFGLYVRQSLNPRRVYESYFSAYCDRRCVERVKKFVEQGGGRLRVAGPEPGNKLWRYYFDESFLDATLSIYVYSTVSDVYIDPVYYGRSLGGALAFSRSAPLEDVAENLAPVAEKLAKILGRDKARAVLRAVLIDATGGEVGRVDKLLTMVLKGSEGPEFPPVVKMWGDKVVYIDADGVVKEDRASAIVAGFLGEVPPSGAYISAPCRAYKIMKDGKMAAALVLCTVNQVSASPPQKKRGVRAAGNVYVTNDPVHISMIVTKAPGGLAAECIGPGDACVKEAERRFGKPLSLADPGIFYEGFTAIATDSYMAYVWRKNAALVFPRARNPTAITTAELYSVDDLYKRLAEELTKNCNGGNCAEEGRRLARDILKALADHDAVEDTVKYDITHME